MPLLALGSAAGAGPLPTAVAVVFMALPTATTSYVMARAMGGDAPLMAAITTCEHLLSMLTPAVLDRAAAIAAAARRVVTKGVYFR